MWQHLGIAPPAALRARAAVNCSVAASDAVAGVQYRSMESLAANNALYASIANGTIDALGTIEAASKGDAFKFSKEPQEVAFGPAVQHASAPWAQRHSLGRGSSFELAQKTNSRVY